MHAVRVVRLNHVRSVDMIHRRHVQIGSLLEVEPDADNLVRECLAEVLILGNRVQCVVHDDDGCIETHLHRPPRNVDELGQQNPRPRPVVVDGSHYTYSAASSNVMKKWIPDEHSTRMSSSYLSGRTFLPSSYVNSLLCFDLSGAVIGSINSPFVS